jgi:hypothetical protein
MRDLTAACSELTEDRCDLAADRRDLGAGRREANAARRGVNAGWSNLAAAASDVAPNCGDLTLLTSDLRTGQRVLIRRRRDFNSRRYRLSAARTEFTSAIDDFTSGVDDLASEWCDLSAASSDLGSGFADLSARGDASAPTIGEIVSTPANEASARRETGQGPRELTEHCRSPFDVDKDRGAGLLECAPSTCYVEAEQVEHHTRFFGHFSHTTQHVMRSRVSDFSWHLHDTPLFGLFHHRPCTPRWKKLTMTAFWRLTPLLGARTADAGVNLASLHA